MRSRSGALPVRIILLRALGRSCKSWEGRRGEKCYTGKRRLEFIPKEKAVRGKGDVMGSTHLARIPGRSQPSPGCRLSPARSWAGASEIPSPEAVPAAVNPIWDSRSCNTEGEEGKVSSEALTTRGGAALPGSPADTHSVLPSGRWDVQGESTVIPRAAFSSEWRREPGPALFIRRGRIQKSGSGATRSFPQSPANPCVPGTMGKHPLQHGKLTVNCLGIIPRSQRSRWAGECVTQ